MLMKQNATVTLTALLVGAAGAGASAMPVFIPLGHLGNGQFSQATSVSDDGRYVGGHAEGLNDGFTPVIWDGATATFLTLPPAFASGGAYVNAISGDGQSAVAIGLSPGGFQGIRWDASGQPHTLPTNPGTFSSFNGINYDGTVAVGFTNQEFFAGSDAVIWTQSGGLQNLGAMPGTTETSFTGVSNDGSRVVGFASGGFSRQAITWDQANGFQVLGTVAGGSGDGIAVDISADGNTIVGSLVVDGGDRPAFWDAAGNASVLDLAAGYQVGEAIAATNNGIVVGNWRVDAFADELGSLAFIWDADNGIRALQDVLVSDYGLDLMGWTLNTVTDITPDGMTIVGTGLNAEGLLEAYRVTVPTPGAAGMLAAAGLLASRRRRG
ncbi:MAG: hypothetical protein LAT64_06195 [Phycisphaerales bacterium]|nr:hypothetical protein [Planctomycetota bacterium]MCH8508345.1 hypothetical protein [Phycisphaerales bacterium]